MNYEAFRSVHKKITSVVNEHEISRGHNREVAAFLCFLTFSILDFDAPQYIPISLDEFMFQRIRLYSNLSHSDLLNNWLCPDDPDVNDNLLYNAFIAFGDLLINSDARKDYHSAPLVVHDLSETVLFGASMLQIVLPLTNGYIEHLFAIKEHSSTVADSSEAEKPEISEETKRIYAEARTRDDLANYKKQQELKERRKNNILKVLCVLLAVSLLAIIWLLPSHTFDETSSPSTRSIVTPTPRATSTPSPESLVVAARYMDDYPMIWDYVSQNAENPYSYILIYDDIWGKMTVIHGDGIALDSLSHIEQLYISYPSIGQYIYFRTGDSTYHSTEDCYMLLGQSTSKRLSKFAVDYSACAKCVRTADRVTPTPEPTPQPTMFIYNGKDIIVPEYEGSCPFEITADTDADYYIYLKYQGAPSYTESSRRLKSNARAPYETDVAFIVKAGNTVSLDVPIGVYTLYYATGEAFYDATQLFGDATRFYKAEGTLSFILSGGYYRGHTITLYPTYDGNLDTDEISENAFPKK